MSAYAGPEISQSGLVFAYDMGNSQKSWKGKPTTNHVPNATAFFGWSNYYRTIERTSFITEFGTTGWRFINQPSWSGLSIGYNVPSTGTYTFSAYYRYLGGTAPNNGGTVYVSGWGGSDSQVSVNKNLVNVWQRVQMTLNLTNLSGAFYLISYGGTDSGTTSPDNTSFEVTMPMIESGSFATPFVDGTRSNTQAILDLIGSNIVTNTELTYNSDGTFKFDGVNDYAAISTFVNKPTTAITMETWIRPTKSSVGTGIHRGGALSCTNTTYLGIIDSTDGGNTFSMHWANQTTSSRLANFNGSIPNNSWSYLVGTYDGATVKAYLNGVEIWTASQTGTIPDGTYVIGTYGPALQDGVHNFNGNINVGRIYNRAVTASEIQQNFNALRGRFGI